MTSYPYNQQTLDEVISNKDSEIGNADRIWSERLGEKENAITDLNSNARQIKKENSQQINQILLAFFVISIISIIVAMINRYIRSKFDQIEISKHHSETSKNYEKTTNEVIRGLKEKHEKALDDIKQDKRNVKSKIKILIKANIYYYWK